MPASLCHALGEYIDVLLDAVCAVDRDGHFQFLSSGAERIFGYPASEMLGRSMLDFIHPDDIPKTLAAAQASQAALAQAERAQAGDRGVGRAIGTGRAATTAGGGEQYRRHPQWHGRPQPWPVSPGACSL